MLNVTLGDLKKQVRFRANMENSKFIDDVVELPGYINLSYAELYDLLAEKGEHWNVKPAQFNITGSTALDPPPAAASSTYHLEPLPSDFYKLVGIDYLLGNQRYPMQKFNFLDRNKYRYNSQVCRYKITGSNIMFTPKPNPQAITMWYIPAITPLVDDADTIDGINGWEEYIIIDAAIKCMVKEESDTSALERAKMAIIKRIEDAAATRDQSMCERVGDITGMGYPDSYWIGER